MGGTIRKISAGAGGGGFDPISATELASVSTTVYTFPDATAQPSYIVTGGVWYPSTGSDGSTVNWTWDNTLKKASMNVPVQTDIFAVPATATTVTFVDNETISGSGTSFALAYTPVSVPQIIDARGKNLVLNEHYSISGLNITTTDSYLSGELRAWYRK